MIVTEKKRIRIDNGCKPYPVYVNWLNTLGGRDYWLFHQKQKTGLDVKSLGQVEPYTPDIQNAQGYIKDLGRTAVPRLTVGAYVRSEDVDAIKGILYSPNVVLLANPDTWQEEGCKWRTIFPDQGSFKLYDTDQTAHTIEISFDLPAINTQIQ
jgi:hypothetical protein